MNALTVTRVRTDTGTHIEPPLDESWDDHTKLCWHAAVIMCDCPGIKVQVKTGGLKRKRFRKWVEVPGVYNIMVGHSSAAPFTYREAWDYLNGVQIGWEAAQAGEDK